MSVEIIDETLAKNPSLKCIRNHILDACQLVIHTFEQGGKVLICGNGGSSSDSDHIVSELAKSFEIKRRVDSSLKKNLIAADPEEGGTLAKHLEPAFPTISLTAPTGLITAITNDIGGDFIFAQQICSIGRSEDLLITLSTSGNSPNVIKALITAKAIGMKTIGFSGESGGGMMKYCDVLLNVPAIKTAEVQELHLPVYHCLCRFVEHHFYANEFIS
ncbi:MAG: SIS domain-containing protein [Opitutales bacterium]|nr:SIS domain-containing protein [Opitutales bacterium]